MGNTLELFYFSSKAVGTVLLVAVAGVLLVRFKVLKDDSLRVLSQVVFNATLPCLLFSKVGSSISWKKLQELWILPLSCVVYIALGLGLGCLLVRLCKPDEDFKGAVTAAAGFGNSGFIPIPLISAVMMIFPLFLNIKDADAIAISFISVYLLGFSPTNWTIGLNLISGKGFRGLKFSGIFTPPVIGMFLGALVGLTPALSGLFCDKGGFLNPVFNAADILGKGTIPFALIVLGGKLAYGPGKGVLKKRVLWGVGLTRLLVMPLMAIGYVYVLRYFKLIPLDPILALVLIVEAAVPPATNLIVMCALKNEKIEQKMATLLFWLYILSVPTLTIFVMLAVYLFQ